MFPLQGGAPRQTTYIEDVFSAYTYGGNTSTQAITNGVDLSTHGGLVWTKERGASYTHYLADTARGTGQYLKTPTTDANQASADRITAFNTTGYSLGANLALNENGKNYISWTSRNAANFFTHNTVSHTNGVATNIDLSSLGVVGAAQVKITGTTGDWYYWHRSLTAGNNLRLNTTAAQSTTNAYLSVSGTTLTISASAPSGTYVYHARAHDDSENGLIYCGSFTTDGSGNATVTTGWEAQYLEIKCISSVPSEPNWQIYDSMRGLTAAGSLDAFLYANTSTTGGTGSRIGLSATGFTAALDNSQTYIFIAIRRGPMRPPTSGTQVYNAVARTGTGAAATVTGAGFPPDLTLFKARSQTYAQRTHDRLRGASANLSAATTSAENSDTSTTTAFGMDGVSLGASAGVNENSTTYINHFFRRYPGVFDQVCYTGDGVAGRQIPHNLTVSPELIIVKKRNSSTDSLWPVYNPRTVATNQVLYLEQNSALTSNASVLFGNGTSVVSPTENVFTVGAFTYVNNTSDTYVAYLFATLAGISKVGSYTGTGTTNQIDCGFAAGARFVLIKRTDSTGDWYLWDSVRGIVAGNDPYLLLNSSAAENTSTDYIDPYAPGFELSSSAPAALNASGGTYVFLAFA